MSGEPWRPREGETREQWKERMHTEWPETLRTLKLIQMIDEGKARRQREAQAAKMKSPS